MKSLWTKSCVQYWKGWNWSHTVWEMNSESKRGSSRKTEFAWMLKAYLLFLAYVYAHVYSCPHVMLSQNCQDLPYASKKVPHMPGASVCFAVTNPWHKFSDFWMPVSFGSFCTSVVVLISTSKICSVFKSLLNNLNVPSTDQAESPTLSCCF